MEPVWERHLPRDPRVAVPIAHGAAARVHRPVPGCPPERLCDGRAARIRAAPVVAASAAQSTGPFDQGRVAVSAARGGYERAVSSGTLKNCQLSIRYD